MTDHLVQFSTGAGSAVVAMLVQERMVPGDNLVLLTADTLVEDDDNWRFAGDVVRWLNERARSTRRPYAVVEWTVLADGRTPMEVGRSERVVPNDRMAVCSRILKRELIRGHLDATFDPATAIVYLGYDWTEEHRYEAAVDELTTRIERYRAELAELDAPAARRFPDPD